MSIESFIEGQITEYLENHLELADEPEVIEQIDAHELALFLIQKLRVYQIKFDGSAYVHQLCSQCGREYGDFVSEQGGVLNSDLVLKQGKTILILDDIG